MEPTNKQILDALIAESKALVKEVQLLKERNTYLAQRIEDFKILIDKYMVLEQMDPNNNR